MNIAESFVQYLISLGFATALKTDIFIGSAPKSGPNNCWWVVLPPGGLVVGKNKTAELQKQYVLNVYYRNVSQETVYNTLHNLEIELNKQGCTQLTDFDTIDIEVISFPTDQDLDSEERTVGLTQVKIITYYKE